jgi:uncharacterized cupredoxin-like copper-binding protein
MTLRKWTALGLVGAAVSAGTAYALTGTTVKVTLKEFSVAPTPKLAKRGRINFSVHNAGKLTHSFVVVRTNLAPGKLPLKGKRVNLAKLKVIGQIASIKPRKTSSLSTRLAAGKYVLFCNLPGHYKAGQYKGFSVVSILPVKRAARLGPR